MKKKTKIRPIRLWGMQRSGNHAIIAWLMRNLPAEDTIFFNDCQFGHPLTSFTSVDLDGDIQTHRIRKLMRIHKLQAVMRAAEARSVHLISYENKQVQHRDELVGYMTPGYPDPPGFTDVVIYRSFLNWLASFYKLKLRTRPKWLDELNEVHIPAYVDHLVEAQRAGTIGVLYDDWAGDAGYRERVLTQMGLPVVDNDIGPVTSAAYGGGSSFDGTRADPDRIADAQRWAHFLDDPRFVEAVRVAFEDEDFRALMAAHFDYTPEVLAQFGITVTAASPPPERA